MLIIEYFSLPIQKLSLLLRRENDASFPRFFIELSVSVIILFWNLDNFNTRNNKLLNAGVFVVYISYIYFMGAGQVFVIWWWAVESLRIVTFSLVPALFLCTKETFWSRGLYNSFLYYEWSSRKIFNSAFWTILYPIGMQSFAAYIDYQALTKACSLLQPIEKCKCSLLQPIVFPKKVWWGKTLCLILPNKTKI